ncbi:MAG: SprT-like domain-containing protein [Planctomycetes bacterium]|nr:SprT-like domain-containing protein [Planctomycetota bacterium]MCW8135112.1 SprT-like domain-containing protein [Planctomycetota bacterium]
MASRNRNRWTAERRHAWRSAFSEVLALCFPRWRGGKSVQLHLTSLRAPGVYAACHRTLQVIRVFPSSAGLGSIALRETLIHECCHLTTRGRHGREWKAAMRRCARIAAVAGRKRLASAILHDVRSYRRRNPTSREVFEQIRELYVQGKCTDYRTLVGLAADWAGWSVPSFERRHRWLKELRRQSTRRARRQA